MNGFPNIPPPDTRSPWREKAWGIIFKADTFYGKLFDVVLLVLICLSITTVMLESVDSINAKWGEALKIADWVFSILFMCEYVLRLYCVRRPKKYALSFFGIVDLLSFLPTFLSLFVDNTHYLLVIRIMRLLRMFRIFKMARYMGEANVLLIALRASRPKITVFLFGVTSLAVIVGTVMYLVEGELYGNPGFSSIPRSIYWSIVTITTVGYGDIVPYSAFGQFLAAVGMITGYAIIAVPTGIIGVEVNMAMARGQSEITCEGCGIQGHMPDAYYCRHCGTKITKKQLEKERARFAEREGNSGQTPPE